MLRSLSPEWNTHAVVWRNKSDLDTMSMDDLYNNIKDLEEIHLDDLEEMDLRWQMVMLTLRARRFLNKTGRKLNINGNETIRFDTTNVECYNYHKRGQFARECKALRSQDTKHKESIRRTAPMESPALTALVYCDGLGDYDWSYQAEEGPNYALMAFTSSTSDSKVSDNEEEEVTQPKIEKKIVKPSIAKIEFAKPKQPEKTARKNIKKAEHNRKNTHKPRGN
nr:hypothetical protein [Tanacetum cinerariifolium]